MLISIAVFLLTTPHQKCSAQKSSPLDLDLGVPEITLAYKGHNTSKTEQQLFSRDKYGGIVKEPMQSTLAENTTKSVSEDMKNVTEVKGNSSRFDISYEANPEVKFKEVPLHAEVQSLINPHGSKSLPGAILSPFPKPGNMRKHDYDTDKAENVVSLHKSTIPNQSPVNDSNFNRNESNTTNSNILENLTKSVFENNDTQLNSPDDYGDIANDTTTGKPQENAKSSTETSSTTSSDENLQESLDINDTDKIKIPFCCFEGQCINQRLPRNLHSDSNLSIPIATNHCTSPKLQSISPYQSRFLDCSLNNRLKIALNEENKIMAAHDKEAILVYEHMFLTEFCIEEDPSVTEQWWAVICATEGNQEGKHACHENKCLRKCCPVGYAFQNNFCVCYLGTSAFSRFKQSPKENMIAFQKEDSFQFQKIGIPDCQHPHFELYSILDFKRHTFLETNENEDDSPILTVIPQTSSSELSCLEESLDEVGNVTHLVRRSCREPKDGVWKTLRKVLIPTGLVVSCLFLLFTLACHLCVATLRDLHGLCLVAYMGALLVADASLFTIKMYSGILPESSCIALGTTVHVSFLSTFMWLNVVCIDIWNYVGQTIQAVPLYRNPSDVRWFIVYGLYAWGCPIVFGGVIGGLQTNPANHNMPFIPDFAHNNCWFDGDDFWETILFFYGPIGVILVVNTFLILHTGLRLYCLHHSCCFRSSGCSFLGPSSSSSSSSLYGSDQMPLHRTHLNEFWERFFLFAILATCWGTELISWLSGSGESEIWGLTDTINAFQGVFIFIIFLRSSRKRRLVKHSFDKWLDSARERSPSWKARICPNGSSISHRINNLRSTVSSSTKLSDVLFKDRLTATESTDNIIYDASSKDDETKSQDPVDDSLQNSVWTVLPQWRSMKTNSYFPNLSSSHSKEAWYQDKKILDGFGDIQSIYLPQDNAEELKQGNNQDEGLCQDKKFAGWNPMRTRSASISFKGKGCNSQESQIDVVCHGVTPKDLK